jgi:hypothetical protein
MAGFSYLGGAERFVLFLAARRRRDVLAPAATVPRVFGKGPYAGNPRAAR